MKNQHLDLRIVRTRESIQNAFIELNEAFDFVRKENFLVPGDYLASYIASAHIGVIQQWLNSGRKESPEEMAKIFSIITFNGPFFAAGLKK